MTNVINFSELGRKEIKCLIFNQNGKIKVEYENLEQMKSEIENPIEIYNPTTEQRGKIVKILKDNINSETGESNINGILIIKEFLPLLTNIKLDLDEEMIKEIVEDPSEILLAVQDELGKITNQIIKRFVDNTTYLMEAPEKERELILKQYEKVEELTEEEMKAIEKAKKLGKI